MLESAAPSDDAVRMMAAGPPAAAEAVEIDEGALWLRLPLPMALDHVNVFAFLDADGWTLVDTGLNTGKTRALWPQLLDGPLGGVPVRRVILTHHHPDHVGMAGWFQSQFGAEILATRTAWLFARMLTLDVQERPVKESLEFYRKSGVPAALMEKYQTRRPFNFADCVMPIPVGFTRIREGDTIRFGGRNWLVRIGHGHAPSHATFWSDDSALVVGGDQFLADITPNIGVYPTEPEANPLAEWLESCERFTECAAGQLVLSGHKRPYTGLPLRLRQLIENHLAALERLRLRLAEPATTHEILETLFERPIREKEYGMAIVEAAAHMNWLHQAGQASRRMGGAGAWIWQCD